MTNKTKKMTRTAMMVALATALSFFKVITLPNGGSITAGSMIPIILIPFIVDKKWGITAAFLYSLLQMILQGIAVPPVQNFLYYILVIFLDYILAYSVLGFSSVFSLKTGNKRLNLISGAGISVFLRFVCHLISGMIIWGVYAPEGQSVFLYSLIYNGSYMLGEFIITVIVAFFIADKIIREE